MNTTWKQEFGASYDVPAIITESMRDTSWGNDGMPTFEPLGQTELSNPFIVLWAEHPDRNKRECDSWKNRFSVLVSARDLSTEKMLIDTDDAAEAVRVALETFATLQAERGAK